MAYVNDTHQTDINSEIKTLKELRKQVEWKDLRLLSKWQILFNLILPYPFLIGALLLFNHGFEIFALMSWFLFFAASFRQAHDGFHGTLGISKKMTDVLLTWSSALIFTSNHAIKQTHLQHHRNPLAESDIEAEFHTYKWWQAILHGPRFWIGLQKHGISLAPVKEKTKISIDAIVVLFSLIIAFVLFISFENTLWLWHIAVMCVANSLVGFVAGWSVHHDCCESGGEVDGHEIIARTERNKLVNFMTFNLLFHMEHHVFPNIPANNLPIIAERIDAIAPQMTSLRVIPESFSSHVVHTDNMQEYRNKIKDIATEISINERVSKSNCPFKNGLRS